MKVDAVVDQVYDQLVGKLAAELGPAGELDEYHQRAFLPKNDRHPFGVWRFGLI